MSVFRIDLSFPPFISEYKQARKKHPQIQAAVSDALSAIELNPRIGDQIPGVGENVFKTRLGVKGLFGKSGGYRLIYYADLDRRVIVLMALYFKREMPNLPHKEITERRSQAAKGVPPRDPEFQ